MCSSCLTNIKHNPVSAVAQCWCRFAPENEHRQTLAEQTDICSVFLDVLIKELQGKAQRRLISTLKKYILDFLSDIFKN